MNDPDLIDATKKSFVILEALMHEEGTTLNALDDSLDYARSTIHTHLMTLRNVGVVTKDGSTYHVGLGMLDFGGQARTRHYSYLVGRDVMDDLASNFESPVQIAFIEDDVCSYVYQAGERYREVTKPRLGTQVDFHSSASGKAIVSSLPEDRQQELIDERDLEKYTSSTITDPEEVHAELEEVRASKIAFDFEEQFEDVWCVSTPVNFDSDHVGALSITYPAEEIDRSLFEKDIADEVHKSGRLIEVNKQYESWMNQSGDQP